MRLIALFLAAGVYLSAQEITGSISGIIMDPSGAVLSGFQVTVTNAGTNISKTVTTGPSSERFPITDRSGITLRADVHNLSEPREMELSLKFEF